MKITGKKFFILYYGSVQLFWLSCMVGAAPFEGCRRRSRSRGL